MLSLVLFLFSVPSVLCSFSVSITTSLKVLQDSPSPAAGLAVHVTQLVLVCYSGTGGRGKEATLGFGGSETACSFTGIS